MRFKIFFVFFTITAFWGNYGYALDAPVSQIGDDSPLRADLKDSWFVETPDKVLGMKPLARTLSGGGKIEVRVESNKNEFGVVLARERNNAYPGWAQGSWVFTRKLDTGDAVGIRVFLRSDPNVYIQFRPAKPDIADKSLMDAVVYDAYLIRSLPLPFSFDRLLTLPIDEILASVGERFPRKYFEPAPALYKDSRNFVASVRKRLPELSFQDDGAFDENGDYVFIETGEKQSRNPGLNCSGFAKWVVDGLLRPVTGERLTIDPLKTPFGKRGTAFTEPYDSARDVFFGLDWVRNLAAKAGSVLLSPNFSKQEEFEVRRWPFQYLMLRSNNARVTESYAGFLEDAGFSLEGLRPLLYTLAIDEPGRVYLAAVNNFRGSSPKLRQYFHIAVFTPYFNEQGNFQVTVFESAAETSRSGEVPLSNFQNRYPAGTFVNLARIPLGNAFEP